MHGKGGRACLASATGCHRAVAAEKDTLGSIASRAMKAKSLESLEANSGSGDAQEHRLKKKREGLGPQVVGEEHGLARMIAPATPSRAVR